MFNRRKVNKFKQLCNIRNEKQLKLHQCTAVKLF